MLFCDSPPQRFLGNTVNLVNDYESGVLSMRISGRIRRRTGAVYGFVFTLFLFLSPQLTPIPNLTKFRRGTKTKIYRHTEAAMNLSPHLQLNPVGRHLLLAPPDGRLFRVSEQYLRI
jgi:hypothetical protein